MQLLKRCRATADFMLHSWAISPAGRLIRRPKTGAARCEPRCGTLNPLGFFSLEQKSTSKLQQSMFRTCKLQHPLLRGHPNFQFDDDDVVHQLRHMPVEDIDALVPDAVFEVLSAAARLLRRMPRTRTVPL